MSMTILDTDIASMFTKLAKIGDKVNAENPREVTYYDGRAASKSPLLQVIRWWQRTSEAPDVVVVMAALYIQRAVKKGLLVTSLSVHRILVSALVVATKYQCDCMDLATNSYYASSFGMEAKELNRLEVRFLNDLEWETFVSPSDLAKFVVSE